MAEKCGGWRNWALQSCGYVAEAAASAAGPASPRKGSPKKGEPVEVEEPTAEEQENQMKRCGRMARERTGVSALGCIHPKRLLRSGCGPEATWVTA
jgi:hypothetical protein